MATYSLNLVTTTTECDDLTTVIEKDRKGLAYKKASLERQAELYAENSVEVDTDLAEVTAELTALQGVVATLPAGEAKDSNEARVKRLELKKFLLTQRDKDYAAVSLIAREFDLACVNSQLAEADALLAAIASRKAAL